jgi:hypothetical protein
VHGGAPVFFVRTGIYSPECVEGAFSEVRHLPYAVGSFSEHTTITVQ